MLWRMRLRRLSGRDTKVRFRTDARTENRLNRTIGSGSVQSGYWILSCRFSSRFYDFEIFENRVRTDSNRTFSTYLNYIFTSRIEEHKDLFAKISEFKILDPCFGTLYFVITHWHQRRHTTTLPQRLGQRQQRRRWQRRRVTRRQAQTMPLASSGSLVCISFYYYNYYSNTTIYAAYYATTTLHRATSPHHTQQWRQTTTSNKHNVQLQQQKKYMTTTTGAGPDDATRIVWTRAIGMFFITFFLSLTKCFITVFNDHNDNGDGDNDDDTDPQLLSRASTRV
jgi:hypothetical protein